MKYFKVTVAILPKALLTISGCALEKAFLPPANNEAVRFNKSANQYYYFIEAQLEKNRGNLDKAILLLKKAIAEDAESLYLQ